MPLHNILQKIIDNQSILENCGETRRIAGFLDKADGAEKDWCEEKGKVLFKWAFAKRPYITYFKNYW